MVAVWAGENQDSVVYEHASDLTKEIGRSPHVFDRLERHDNVYASVRKVDSFSFSHADVRPVFSPRVVDHLRVNIHPDHVGRPGSHECSGAITLAASNVEDAFALNKP